DTGCFNGPRVMGIAAERGKINGRVAVHSSYVSGKSRPPPRVSRATQKDLGAESGFGTGRIQTKVSVLGFNSQLSRHEGNLGQIGPNRSTLHQGLAGAWR